MSKSFFLLMAAIWWCSEVTAQTDELHIRKGEKGFFLEHITAAKENFFSIGRLYGVHPRFLASFNALDMKKGLSLGQALRIPLSDSNFSKEAGKGAPVYYLPGAEEEIGKISQANKVTVDKLKKWNQLSGENIPAGKKLIVGFLISGELAQRKEIVIADYIPVNTPPVEVKPPVHPVKEPIEQKMIEEKPNTIIKEEVKKEVAKAEPAKTIAKEEIKSAGDEEGFFRPSFNLQVKAYPLSKEAMVTAGIFTTISGWQDKKFYVLIDQVEPGTVVQLTNPSNNKIIYAKVLYGMEGIRQNQGLDIRISNAAAAALGITENDKFIVKVNY